MNRRPAEHPSDEQLVAWREAPADLLPPARQGLADHMAMCPQCTARLAQLAAVETGLQRSRRRARCRRGGSRPGAGGTAAGAVPPADLAGLGAAAGGGLGFMLAGLAALLLSGDTWGDAARWWQAAWLWLDNAGAGESDGLTTWLAKLPAGSQAVHLGLLPGALLLGGGALLVLAVGNLRGPAGAAPRRSTGPPSQE